MNKLTRRTLVAALLTTPVAYFGSRWLSELAADPIGEKSCLPVDAEPETLVEAGDLPGMVRGGAIDDASCLNATPIHGRVKIESVEDIQKALAYARERGLKVSAAGVRHSMGGQAFVRDGLVLDMRTFDGIEVDTTAKTVTVQAGATWHAIQNRLHPLLAVKAMQSTDIFTVGGSISVNAHGMDHQIGSMMRTIRSMRVVMADGSVRTVSRSADPELFGLIVGGYGLFGIIAEAELDVTDNVILESERATLDYTELPAHLEDRIMGDDQVELFYAHLSTAPGAGFLREALLYAYKRVANPVAELPPLGEVGMVKVRRLIINLAKRGGLLAQAKWFAEKNIDPMFESCSVTRQLAQVSEEGCFVSRNEPMHDSVPYLMNSLNYETDILHEYFIPRASFVPFIDAIRAIMEEEETVLLNASIRVVHAEENFLSYAPEPSYSVVLYVNQPADAAGNAKMARLTERLIDATIDAGGRHFLPYQLHYDRERLVRAYPEIEAFFAAKDRYDPDGVFSNTFHRKYAAA